MSITVITTVYNDEEYIVKCIESVQNQSVSKDLYIEHIIIDDGSTDNTASLIKSCIEEYNNIKYYNFGKIGRAKALNKGIEMSEGNYIVNLDSDDIFIFNKLEQQYNFMENSSDYKLSCTNYFTFTDDIVPNYETKSGGCTIGFELLKKNIINHSSVMFDKETLIKIGKYDETRSTQIDLELWLRYLEQGYKIYKLNAVLTGKRIHDNQSFERKNRLKYSTSALKLKLYYVFKTNNIKYLPIIIIRYLLGLAPEKIRSQFRQ